ncbi:MAG: hypothetical protein AAGI66_05840 [Cyanobacteria bacterium P01_H01_bin.74]
MTQRLEMQTIPEIVEKHPQSLAVFCQFGINPEGYKALAYENLSATCHVHQISLDTMLQALEAALLEAAP